MTVKEKEVEEVIEKEIKNIEKDDFKTISKNLKSKKSIYIYIIVSIISTVIIGFFGFTAYNLFNPNIISGVSIKGVDVSGLSKSDAKLQLENYIEPLIPEEIKVKHGEFETTLSTSQIEAKFDLRTAANNALSIGRTGNILQNDFYVLNTMFNKVNIEPVLTINKIQLTKNLEDISTQLPDKVTESSYFIEGNELVVTPGKEGIVVDVDASIEIIKTAISNLSTINEPIELAVKNQAPEEINIDKIYEEVRKEPKDAYYTTEPFSVIPSENGVDFNISIEEAKTLISNQTSEEYSIPLKFITPNVTTNMIGTEAFPDQLSTFSTKYNTYDRNRTTNLILASNKINGTVVMPGETFSYNKVVGARTIAAGYKEASVYVNGQVVDGIGGGICQITTILYNAAVYANLKITQRTNHQFIPSYVTASRDATVSYGSIDFQFKNNRDYPIKIVCSVSGGVASLQIFGMRQENDCEVQISSYQTGTTASAIYSEAYKILKRDGVEVGRELLSKDVYKRH